MRKLAYKTGVGLVTVSFLLSVSSYYLLVFTIPLFIIGAILVWIFGRSLPHKLVISLAPILLYIPCTIAFLYLYNYSPAKLIIIPRDHVGKFRILHNEPCGESYSLTNGMKTIKINEQGLAVMHEKFDGKLNFKYQFSGMDSAHIPLILDVADTARYDIAILTGAAGVHYVSTSLDQDDASGVDFRYSDFYLYRKGNFNNWSDEPIDSLTQEIVRSCRGGI